MSEIPSPEKNHGEPHEHATDDTGMSAIDNDLGMGNVVEPMEDLRLGDENDDASSYAVSTVAGSDDLSSAPTREQREVEEGVGMYMLPELPEDMEYGKKGRPAFKLGKSKVVDLYYGVTPNTSKEDLVKFLEGAWAEEKLTTIQVIFQLGNCRRGEGGKADRTKFEQALEWLVGKDLETVLLNVEEVGKHGCLKVLIPGPPCVCLPFWLPCV